MKTSYRVASIAGIDINVHVTFGLILVFGAVQWGVPYGPRGALFGVLLMIVLFACVVLHEIGHSLVAKAFGIPVRTITLLPIGGVSQMEKNPDTPGHELLIAVAGPLVNFAIAGLLLVTTDVSSVLEKTPAAELTKTMVPGLPTALLFLFMANLFLAAFNLVPAFPMDGGRVLRALLAMFLGLAAATRIAAAVGQFLAMALGLFGLLSGNFLLALIAVFIYFGAGQERAEEQARVVLGTTLVGDAYNKNAITLAPGASVSQVVDHILTSYQPDFAVLQGTKLLGVVSRDDILKSLATDLSDAYVTGIMHRDVLHVDAGLTLEEVREQMNAAGRRLAAVDRGDAFLGLVSREDIAEALLVIGFSKSQEARRKAAAAG
ncbi:MAG: site-2 protease family protein [Acidithiobacillales bacterium]